MAYWEQMPANPALRPLVASVCFSSDDVGNGAPVPVCVLPDGCADLLVSVPDVPVSAGCRPCHAGVFGLKTKPLWVQDRERVHKIAFRFRPGALSRILDVPATDFTDAEVDLEDVLGAGVEGLLERIAVTDGPLGRASLIETMLLRLAGREAASDDSLAAVSFAADLVSKRQGDVTIRQLCDATDMGERRLERLFARFVGVSPKKYIRLLRFQAALRMLQRGTRPARVAAACGYFDQPHMNRDFRQFAEASPASLGG